MPTQEGQPIHTADLWIPGFMPLSPPGSDTPIELRVYNPAPPRSIVVHGEKIDLQTAKNPFRVGEGLKPPVSRE